MGPERLVALALVKTSSREGLQHIMSSKGLGGQKGHTGEYRSVHFYNEWIGIPD